MPTGSELVSTAPTRLALLGAGIAHSRSPAIYRRLIGDHIHYELLDLSRESDLPAEAELAVRYDGVSITTPWKAHYAAAALGGARALGAVNCLRFRDGRTEATNTDWTALREMVPAMAREHHPVLWVLIGDGVMARVFAAVMQEKGMDFVQYARPRGDEVATLDLPVRHPGGGTKIVVNACGRGFSFAGNADATWVFWDFNYAHAIHETRLPCLFGSYIDGVGLLETQAKHAIKFWSGTLSD